MADAALSSLRRLAIVVRLVVTGSRTAKHALLHHVRERNRRQEHVNLPTKLLPEIVRDAARSGCRAAPCATRLAARGGNRLVDRQNDIGDAQLRRWPAQSVAAARAPHTSHQATATKLREELLEIRQRNF